MKLRLILLACLILPFVLPRGTAQSFSVEAYKQFLKENGSLTSDALQSMHDAGRFKGEQPSSFSAAAYSSEIDKVFELTSYEKSLVNRHGFMVTERLTYPSFGDAFHHVFIKDLPVFVSTDAILHALHKSYDGILMDIESSVLVPTLGEMLGKMRAQLQGMAVKYSDMPDMGKSIDDADVYLTVSMRLLSGTPTAPVFSRNAATVNELMELIAAEQPAQYPLFGEQERMLDFSQFTVRGHYTQQEDLGRYFRAMMWIGRTEIYLSEIEGSTYSPTPDEVRRQTILSVLLAEAARDGQAMDDLDKVDRTLRFMIGESDNVTMANLLELLAETGATNAADLLKQEMLKDFQDRLAVKPYAGQKILSQILFTDPMSPDKITPASAFLLLGQRFVIDSYVMGSVVYDKLAAPRMLPSSLDVLFALGNDAALHLLEPELQRYHYAKELAGLRYLIDAYDPEYWTSTLYTGWLGAIRTLNPPQDRTELPRFMQTAAWWQEKMNTQLASWAQLRHDNLLYAKQSYSGGIGCSYPEGYVEPIPAFYNAVAEYAARGKEIFGEMEHTRIANYFATLENTSRTLEGIARKELAREELNSDEKTFLQTMLSQSSVGCGEIVYNGWYPALFYGDAGKGVVDQDLVVADVHTAPTDADGNFVGWVMHVGTGPINMAVIVCDEDEDGGTAYVGPVMSYHEHVTTNFQRLTDEEWADSYLEEQSVRPALTNLYLADKNGGPRGEVVALKTEVSSVKEPVAGTAALSARVFPNPFGDAATVSFSVPPGLAGENAVVTIHDLQGRKVAELLNRTLPTGNFMARWDGTTADGVRAANGVYYYTVQVGNVRASGAIERMSIGN